MLNMLNMDVLDAVLWKGASESLSSMVVQSSFDIRFIVLVLLCVVLDRWFNWSKERTAIFMIIMVSLIAR